MQRLQTIYNPFKSLLFRNPFGIHVPQMRNRLHFASKICVSGIDTIPVHVFMTRTLCRNLANSQSTQLTGSSTEQKSKGSQWERQESSLYTKNETRLHPSRKSRGSFDREAEITDRYKENYASNKRYTKRPLEEERISEKDPDDRLNEGPIDPGDVFGTLSDRSVHRNHIKIGSKYDTEPDSDGEDWVRPRGRRNTAFWFAKQMDKLCKDGKLKEAIEMLEIQMLKVERVKPTAYNYNILIGHCGRAGYTKMAFKLYNNMKKRGIAPEDVTYTALINACAEGPWPTTDGIMRLRKLHGQLQMKRIHLNRITYHALMKAYAKCGDVKMSFDLFRHLLVSSRHVSTESFNFFLFACGSDREAGLFYAIQGWRHLRQRKIKPDIYTYNLLIRITRDCGIGDLEVANTVLLQMGDGQELLPSPPPPQQTNRFWKRKEAMLHVNPGKERTEIFPINVADENLDDDLKYDIEEDGGSGGYDDDDGERKHKFWWEEELSNNKRPLHNQTYRKPFSELPAVPQENLPMSQTVNLPNLLDASKKQLENVVSLGSMDMPQNRLALLGGSAGILENIRKDGIQANIKTFGILSEIIPNTKKADRELMVAMDAASVKGDLDFYNGLIRRRAGRRDFEGCKEVLTMLSSKGLFPTVKTYGNLATGCVKSENGLELIDNMVTAGLKPNIQIFASLIGSANRVRDYGYIVKLLQLMLKHEVQVNDRILQKLETIVSFHQDKAKTATTGGKKWTRHDDREINKLRQYYVTWLDKIKMAVKEHPWAKFRPDTNLRPNQEERDQ